MRSCRAASVCTSDGYLALPYAVISAVNMEKAGLNQVVPALFLEL